MDTNEARRVLQADKEVYHKRAFGGKNWPFYYAMQEFKKSVYQGVSLFPNLREIDAAEFAQHPCISGSYSSELLSSASVAHMEGIKYTRYARVLFQPQQANAGRGVAFVAVPENPEEWDKSQHYHSEVKHKLRHWTFCLCDHKFSQVAYRMFNTTYACSECDWHYEVDSS